MLLCVEYGIVIQRVSQQFASPKRIFHPGGVICSGAALCSSSAFFFRHSVTPRNARSSMQRSADRRSATNVCCAVCGAKKVRMNRMRKRRMKLFFRYSTLLSLSGGCGSRTTPLDVILLRPLKATRLPLVVVAAAEAIGRRAKSA